MSPRLGSRAEKFARRLQEDLIASLPKLLPNWSQVASSPLPQELHALNPYHLSVSPPLQTY